MEEKKTKGIKNAAKWKEVMIGGFSGIALGAAGTLFTSAMPNRHSSDSDIEDDEEEEVLDDETIDTEQTTGQQATGQYDNMSFGEAFAAARAEVGPGGVFEWHGGLYGTYTANEWSSMSPSERDEYYASIHWDGPSHQYVASNTNHSSTSHSNHSENVHQAVNTNTVSQDDDDVDVEIIGVEHANIDGEHDSIIGTASINGQSVYFVDIDGEDDEFEMLVADVNANNQIDDGEVIDISEQHISVSQFEQQALANQSHHGTDNEEPVQYYANNEDLPDYVNDADPGVLS